MFCAVLCMIFFRKNELPTLDKVMAKIQADVPLLAGCSRTTIHKMLRKMGFSHKEKVRNSDLLDRKDLLAWRSRYLRSIDQYRREGRHIIYLDETWLNEGHTTKKKWRDTKIRHQRQAFTSGLTTGLKDPSGKGQRLIILHAGSKHGFVNGGLLVFHAKKSKTDYHEEMDGTRFENWFQQQLLPNIPSNSVIVMDNASYHSVREEKVPTMSSKKQDIVNFLKKRQ